MGAADYYQKLWDAPRMLDAGGQAGNVLHRRFNLTGASPDGEANFRPAFVAVEAALESGVIPAGTYRITSNLTLTKDWRAEKGAVLRPDPGVTVSIAGTLRIVGSLEEVIDTSAGGAFLLVGTVVGLQEEGVVVDGGMTLRPHRDAVYQRVSRDGAEGAGWIAETPAVSTVAVPILDVGEGGGLVQVTGRDGGSAVFFDLVFYSHAGSAVVVLASSGAGSPASRTYSTVADSGELKLRVASGTYRVCCRAQTLLEPAIP